VNLFKQSQKQTGEDGLLKVPSRRLRIYSIPTVLRGRHFKGGFEIGGATYQVMYAPVKAALAGRRLQLQGRLTVKGADGRTHSRDQVRATLVGTQGGIGTAPTRPGNVASGATASAGLPDVESTGATSFCGAMYIHFQPLVGRALGVNGDLGRVQLNVRFAPINDGERSLQAAYSTVVDALFGKKVDASKATLAIGELNKLLAES
jgi:hypothetical protein